ncbi:MAG: FlgD immunoglobulin-like domain containing protein [Candidatus Eisenbacteria bacterium]
MRIPTRLLLVCATMLATATTVGVPISRAQCTITGPDQVCPGDSIELCGPALDNATYLWQDPDGIMYMTDCILAFGPGLYTLRVLDPTTRVWSEPCSLTVRSGRADAPTITGPTSTCTGTAVNWCGPSGSFEYAWSGPSGFTASTACVTVGNAGDYLLRVRSPGGCWGDSTARSLTVTSCGGGTVNCPRPAWWWAVQCSEWNRRGHLDQTQIAAVAGCVDDRSTVLSWTDDAAGFTRTMERERFTLRMRARRQFAAVWANVCAGQLGVTPRSGQSVSLDPATPVDASLGGGTVASWLALADAELSRLDGMPERSRLVREAYRGLIRTGWNINHGHGIGTTCQSDLQDDLVMAGQEGMTVAGQQAMMATPDGVEPLAGELVDDSDGPLTLGDLQPNPFSTQTSLAFSVSTTATGPVSIAVFDVTGRLVRQLVNGMQAPGQYVVQWDGSAADGTPAKSGLYFIRGRVGNQQVESRVTFIR